MIQTVIPESSGSDHAIQPSPRAVRGYHLSSFSGSCLLQDCAQDEVVVCDMRENLSCSRQIFAAFSDSRIRGSCPLLLLLLLQFYAERSRGERKGGLHAFIQPFTHLSIHHSCMQYAGRSRNSRHTAHMVQKSNAAQLTYPSTQAPTSLRASASLSPWLEPC